jgi:hydroxymethylpyrimidine/phosphomethylpyrimidine kinase
VTHVLAIGGTDSSGGAGIMRDALTIAALGAIPYSVVTAVTAQSHANVLNIKPLSGRMVRAQLDAAYASAPPAAIKIGMLANAAIVEAVVDWLQALPVPRPPVVLDPVLAASSGARLLSVHGITMMQQRLMPLVALVTPNLPEATILLRNAQPEPLLAQLGAVAVLLKGGHSPDSATASDILWQKNHPPQYFSAPRLTNTMRGTGCMLASAIATLLAQHYSLPDACAMSKNFVWQRINKI